VQQLGADLVLLSLNRCFLFSDVLEAEKELAGLCSNWQQFHLLTRRKEQERDPGQEPTRQAITSESNYSNKDSTVHTVECTGIYALFLFLGVE
jgi:hypothetical protein